MRQVVVWRQANISDVDMVGTGPKRNVNVRMTTRKWEEDVPREVLNRSFTDVSLIGLAEGRFKQPVWDWNVINLYKLHEGLST